MDFYKFYEQFKFCFQNFSLQPKEIYNFEIHLSQSCFPLNFTTSTESCEGENVISKSLKSILLNRIKI